ncbi:Centromere-associated protein like [Actinidia chinensis var. chinensis]|uniref:Centromere-associated protein like n=1 Tax=Actinidia chinensis var. chinensis TaxID=1590841 RepID=A0A2R6R4P2_ACTCC|nr:Centromere-associated protein like [Actinidia chinensis var. chinensis]
MDKNKNRTDLLVAGRKRLQQFRQKKDSKGSKSSGKAGKSERDSDADAAPDAAKPAAVLLPVPDAEVRPVYESDAAVVDSSVVLSRDSSQSANMDIATIDPLSAVVVPETGSVTTTLAGNVELQPEDLGVDEATMKLSVGKEQNFDSLVSYQVDSTHTVNSEDAGLASGDWGSVVSETNSVYLDTPIGIESSTPPDLGGSSKPVAFAVEADSIHGADQGADCLALKQIDRSSGIELEGDSVLDLPGPDGGAESCAGTVSGETSMKELIVEVNQANALNDVSASAGEANEVKEGWIEVVHSVSSQPLPESLLSSDVNPEVAVHQREDLASPFFNEEKSEIPSAECVEADIQGEEVGVKEGFSMFKGRREERLMEGKMVSLSSDGGIISISLSQIVEVLRQLDEEEFRLLLTARESAANANFRSAGISTTSTELQSSSQLVVPDYQFSDVLERLKEQLYLTNFAKDVFLLQLDEQSELQMKFDRQHKQLLEEMSTASTLGSEIRGRNESLTEELAKYKSELQATVCAKEELEKQLHTAKAEVVEISTRADELHVELKRSCGELSSMSMELADSNDLVAGLQVENAILNGSFTSAVEETKKLAEEKGYLALGNEKLLMELSELHVELKRSCGELSSMSMELAECSDLVSGLQVENAILNGSLSSAVEETKKLAEEKGYLALRNENLLTELSECKDSLASLQVENLNLSGSLALTTKEIMNLEEVKDNFVRENEKLLTDLAECMALLESLHEENANLNGSLTSRTEERNKLIEEKGHLVSENEKLSMELADVKSLMEGIKVEHRKAVDGLNDATLCLEQLTEENIKLSSSSVEDANQLEGSDMPSRGPECATAADDTPRLPRKAKEQLELFMGEIVQFESVNNKLNSELIDKAKDMEVLKKRGFESDIILKLVEDVEGAIKLESTGIDSDKLESRLQALIYFLFQKYKEAEVQVSLSKETIFCKELELSELQGQIDHLIILIVQHENESLILKESMRQGAEHLVVVQAELHDKVHELEQSEQRVSSIRDKLSIAVSKGKGLIVQRDNLKKSLAETSNELEKCSQELQLKDARLQEVETKLKTYSEAGERVEALESELSYIRNSATALRESFLLKDSVLQRIEEILEDLELPEHFHSRDIIEKVDWLAHSVTGNSLPLIDWDQKSSVGGGSYSDTGFVSMDAWKEDTHPNSNSADDLRRKYEELQSKFYGLAEQNEMLEQSLMERNNVVQRWEDILERINIPLQLRSMEPEDRIEWLGSALAEAQQHCDALQRKVYNFETYCDSLQQKVDNLETYCATLTTDLEESQKRFSDLEAALQAVIREKEHLSESLDILTRDYDKVSEKVVQFEVENDKLQNEVTALKDKLVEKIRNQEHIEHIEGEITRLEKLVSDVLQNSGTDGGVSGGSSTECLERVLRKLVEKYTTLSSEKPILVYSVDEQTTEKAGAIPEDKRDSEEQDLAVLKKELEDALHDLMCVKEERDRYVENNQSLTREVESLVMKRLELQELLSQEEQKSLSVREKLNVAVRKGKSLVQQRDSLKQTIEEVNNEVERLKSEINNRESSLSDYEQKIKHLSTYQERVGLLESESLFLKNRLAETEYCLHEKTHILSLILNALNDNDTGLVFNINDPVEKLEQIGNQWRNLHAAVASSENDIRKSKRAAELLLAELNEVQERNDGLQEELVNASSGLSELFRERDLAEAAKREAFSRFEKLSSIRFEERNNQFAELMVLKSCVDQLMKDFFDINDFLADILSKDLEYLHNLEVNMISCLDPSEALSMVGQPLGGPRSITSANAENKETFLATSSLLDLKMQERIDESNFVEIVILLGHQLQVFMKEIGCHKESLYKHLIALDEGAKHVSGVAGVVRREVTSQKQSCESMKENIIRLECIEKEKDTESIVMRRNISLLYEACSSSVMEIENWKSQFVGNDLAATDRGLNSGSSISLDGWKLFSDQTLLSSEDNIRTMADKLLSAVKDFICIQAKIVGGGQKEMKTTISNLQKELQEKDIQKDRICVELVSQIKEAEATASSYLQDFQSAKAQLYDSERRLEVMEEERNTLEQRVKELQDGEATLKDLDERVRSLNDVLAAKEQEIEVLMQALDEEETQMEELTNKIGELERVVQQKNVDMENLEASRGKVMKKLSITVSKFDELHNLSASLLSEVEKLQSQLQERDAEISFLRQEVTRCTNDALVASHMSNKRNSDEIQDLLTWLDTMVSGLQLHDVHFDDKKRDHVHEYKEMFQKQIMCLLSELEDLREVVQSRDMLLQVERSKVEELTRKGEALENSLRKKESQLTGHQGVGDSGQTESTASEITEVQPVINKWVPPGTSITPQVRSLRKVNNDQVAIAIDMEPRSGGRLEDEDDDKAHGFKSLTTSRIVPRFTRPVTDMIDGLWVSCDRALMRQPALRLGVIIYWALLHALLATFVV